MFRTLGNLARLIRAARLLARYDALFPPEFEADVPAFVKFGRAAARIRLPWERLGERLGERTGERVDGSAGPQLSGAMETLGPSYIKLGQFLATRPDIIGPVLAKDLSLLQDRLPPFPRSVAVETIETEFGLPLDALFADFGEPVAAASIAQVHWARARLSPRPGPPSDTPPDDETAPEKETEEEGPARAVKVLRPGVEKRFAADLDAFFWAARLIERFYPPARRLRPVDIVQTLADSVELEMDLRLEAAALSEMAENTQDDPGFRVPAVDWSRTARRVLSLEWIDGVPASDRAALVAAGHDMARLGTQIIQSFLTHALRDGFFHADMHQGNLFVEPDGTIVAVDFGIMGRLDAAQRRFLAEILYGFVQRDYRRVAEVHFEAGYVPRSKPVDAFAQALRAIGEPIFGRAASEVSMGRLLAQLFQVTEQFDMQTRPELILLQKTMVVVEGVARHFDPGHNIWDSAEPVLKDWMTRELSPEARLQEGAVALGRAMSHLPGFLDRAERTSRLMSGHIDADGIRLHPDTADAIARAQASRAWPGRTALWVAAAALALIALTQIF